jgi:hypothetical protein
MLTSERLTWVSRDVPGSRRIVLSADAANVVLDSECDGVMRWTTDYPGAWWEVSTSSEVPAGAPRVQAALDRVQHDRIASDFACDGEPCVAFVGAAGLRGASADGTSVSAAIPEQGVCMPPVSSRTAGPCDHFQEPSVPMVSDLRHCSC